MQHGCCCCCWGGRCRSPPPTGWPCCPWSAEHTHT
jgi:hypothetical protein